MEVGDRNRHNDVDWGHEEGPDVRKPQLELQLRRSHIIRKVPPTPDHKASSIGYGRCSSCRPKLNFQDPRHVLLISSEVRGYG
jgi:hypothetical protein